MRKLKLFRPRVRTKNYSAEILRPKNKSLPLFPFRSVVRLGSTSEVSGVEVEVNTVESVRNSSNKLKMKTLFEKEGVKHSLWYTIVNKDVLIGEHKADKLELPYPLLAKKVYGFKGKGMVMIASVEELNTFLDGDTSGYYIEKFYNYGKEYRIHTSITSDCFYTCRKVRRTDAAEKWFFNSTNCNWLVEENIGFDRPNSWKEMVQHAKKALIAVGLDVGAVDIRVQSNSKDFADFIVCEINSAPAFGDITTDKYLKEIPKIIMKKRNG